ncbi:MAG: hypothetical protein NT069_03310, partial [Planctomycetota bacterium]|nr:hypothetical protein [Planctomycetota bacterium]
MTRVIIFHRAGRPYFEAQWRDPTTEKKRTRSLYTADRREAQRKAAQLELEIVAGRRPTNTTWSDAVRLYEAEVFPALAPDSRSKIRSTTRLVTQVVNPARLSGLTEAQLARVVADLRARQRTESTVRGHIRNLRAFLRWAVGRQILERLPQ